MVAKNFMGTMAAAAPTLAPLGRVSEDINAIPIELTVDPELPVVDSVLTEGQIEYIAIPAHRIVGLKSRTMGDNLHGVRPYVTLAGPRPTDPNPLGIAMSHFYKELPGRFRGLTPTVTRQEVTRFPFVNGSINTATSYNSNLNGLMDENSFIVPDAWGRPVKYVPQQTVSGIGVADATPDVTIALPATTGRYVPLFNLRAFDLASGELTAATIATAWNSVNGCFDVTVSGTGVTNAHVIMVQGDYGHQPQKVIGRITRIRTGVDPTELAVFLKRSSGGAANAGMGPILDIRVRKQVTATAITLDSTDDDVTFVAPKYVTVKLADTFIDPTMPILVEYAKDGTNYTTLQNMDIQMQYSGRYLGPRFSLEPAGGLLHLFFYDDTTSDDWIPTDSTSKIRVTYQADYIATGARMGANPGLLTDLAQGIKYLTDGSLTGGVAGMTPNAALHPDGAAGFVTAAMARKSGTMEIAIF